MFNKLSMEDKQTIEYYIDNYACDAAHNMAEKASVKHILRFWDSSKSVSLNKLFGEELIISKPFCIEKSEDSISDVFKTSDNVQYNDFLRVFNRKCGSKWDWIRTFNIEWPEDGYLLSELVSPVNLAKNIWEGKTFKVPLENGKFITIQKGCKITRVLGKLAAAWDIEALFEHFRIFHSQVLNDKELKGELCLSIHPLDYLTMSDNDCNWSSCMSWRDYGCYRQGTVEMMNSQFVVVAYLKSREDMWVSKVHDYYWNSKKWRCLFVVSKDMIVGIKGYPYPGYQLQKETLNWIKELASERLGWEYEDETFKYNGHNIIELKRTFNFETGMMYNDFGSCDHFMKVGKDFIKEPYCSMYISGPSECMCCGEECYPESEGDLICKDCDGRIFCSECGEILEADEVYWFDGIPYCRYCYDDNISTDPFTENEFYRNSGGNYLYMIDDSKVIREKPYTTDDIVYTTIMDEQDENVLKLFFKEIPEEERDEAVIHGYRRFNNKYFHFREIQDDFWERKVHFVYKSQLTKDGLNVFRNYC